MMIRRLNIVTNNKEEAPARLGSRAIAKTDAEFIRGNPGIPHSFLRPKIEGVRSRENAGTGDLSATFAVLRLARKRIGKTT